MASLRGLPYRVVCAIGLDDGAFPARTPRNEFDLMQAAPAPGDRQRRLDDRNILLDLLLAARDFFHVSYVGRSVRDNAPLPPAAPVSELVDYVVPAIAGAAAEARSRLTVAHPLQPFSAEAFDASAPHAAELRRRTTRTRCAAPQRGVSARIVRTARDDDADAAATTMLDAAPRVVEAQAPFFDRAASAAGTRMADGAARAAVCGSIAIPAGSCWTRRLGVAIAGSRRRRSTTTSRSARDWT